MKEKSKFVFPNIEFPVFAGFEPDKCYIKPTFYEYEKPPYEFLIVENEDLRKIKNLQNIFKGD